MNTQTLLWMARLHLATHPHPHRHTQPHITTTTLSPQPPRKPAAPAPPCHHNHLLTTTTLSPPPPAHHPQGKHHTRNCYAPAVGWRQHRHAPPSISTVRPTQRPQHKQTHMAAHARSPSTPQIAPKQQRSTDSCSSPLSSQTHRYLQPTPPGALESLPLLF